MKLMSRVLTNLGVKGVSGLGPDLSNVKMTLSNALSLNQRDRLDKPYSDSVWVYSSVSAIANNLAKIPVIITERGTDNRIEDPKAPISMLIHHPNIMMSKLKFMFFLQMYLDIYGEAFLVMDRSSPEQLPQSMWVFNPTRFTPVINNNYDALVGWEYQKGNTRVPLSTQQVRQHKYPNPYDSLRGFSPLEAGKLSIEQDFFAAIFNKKFFEEGVRVSGYISIPTELSTEGFNRLIDQFESRHAGMNRAHKIAVIDNDGKFMESKITQRDMDYIELRRMGRQEIFAIYKVNEVVLGIYNEVQCYHPDTDVMTDRGFVSVKDVKKGDKLASIDCDGKVAFQSVTKTYSYDYVGDMYTQSKKDKQSKIDYMVTKEHKMYGKAKGVRREIADDAEFEFVRVSELEKDRFASPRNGKWSGKLVSTYNIPKNTFSDGRSNGRKSTEFAIVPFLRFLGWFISEGCFINDGKTIKITQSDEYNKDILRNDLTDLGYGYNEIDSDHGTDFFVHGKDLHTYLIDNVGRYCHEKRVPRDVLELHPVLLSHLFDTLMLGDGCSTGGDAFNYYTTSEQLIEDVYELCIRIGRVPTMYPTRSSEVTRWVSKDADRGRELNRRPLFKLRVASRAESDELSVLRPEKVEYSGKVYCFEVPPQHTVLVRYNGRVMWCGNSYEGVKMAHKSFWEECMLPRIMFAEDFLNNEVFDTIEGGRYKITYDLATVGALHEDYGSRVTTAKTMVTLGWPLNAVNDRLELGMNHVPWGDTWWVPMGMLPVDSVLAGNDTSEEDKPKPDPYVDDEPEEKPEEPEDEEEETAGMSSDADKAYWSKFIAIQTRLEELARNKIKKFFFDQRKQILENLYSGKTKLIDIDKETRKLKHILGAIYLEGTKIGVNMIRGELGVPPDEAEEEYMPELKTYVLKRLDIIPQSMMRTVIKQLNAIVENKNLSSREDVAEAIRGMYNRSIRRVNNVIARTESSSVIVIGRILQMQRSGVQYHRWVSSKIDKGRDAHLMLNNTVKRIGESFSDEFTLRYPGDLSAPISEIIGCRCVTVMADHLDGGSYE